MTGVPPYDSVFTISVLDMSSSTGASRITLVLAEQLRCTSCGRVSTRWETPAGDIVPGQRGPATGDGPGGHEPGE